MSHQDVIAQDPEQLIVRSRSDIRLRGSKCTKCATYFFPRRWECAIDQAACEDVELSDHGTLHVATYVNNPAYGKAQLDSVGYGVGQIDLPEGPRVQAVLLGDQSDWASGTPVQLTSEELGIDDEGRAILAYRFVAEHSAQRSPELRVGYLAGSAAARWADRPFTVLQDRTLTFAELSRWVDAIATDLVARGVSRGDRVVVHLPNGYEVLIFQLAAWRIGAVAVPVVPIYRRREIAHIIASVMPKVVVTIPTLPGREPYREFDEVLDETGAGETTKYLVGGDAPGWLSVPEMPPASSTFDDLPEPGGPDDCCLILFTSGTTSAPKGAMLTSRAVVTATAAWVRAGIGQDDVAFAAAPLAHIAGMIPGGLVPLTVGCSVVIATRWIPAEAIDLIDRYGATFSCGATVFLQDLIDGYANAPASTHRLSFFVSGGAATPPDLIRKAEAAGIHATRAYGMTETAGVVTMASASEDLERRATFDGKLVDDVQMIVVDEAGKEVSPGTEGIIRIRGEQAMMGYTDPVVTAEQLREGWFEPGDLGLVTGDRWFRMTGRTKDIINRGGEKFSARDIEEVILAHPDVARVAVTAVPHERFGEAVGAWLVLESASSWSGPEPLLAHLDRAGLAKAKFPISWTIVDALPMTPSGKVQKHLLVLNPTLKE